MALLTNLSLKSADPRRGDCPNYDDLLRRTEQQRTLAGEMIKRAQQMIDSATSMRNQRCSENSSWYY